MRVGLIADVHSDVAALTDVIAALRLQQLDRLVSLGDALECHLPKEHDGTLVPLGEATSVADEVAALLADAYVLRGNQEERILAGSCQDGLTAAVRRLLEAPASLTTQTVTYVHGHELDWDSVGHGHWQPRWPAFGSRVIVHGHHHRSSLTALVEGPEGEHRRVDRTPPSGLVIRLRPNERYLLNVGPAQMGCLAWAVLDDEKQTAMLHYQTIRPAKERS